MDSFEFKSNNDLVVRAKELFNEHESLKSKILNDYDRLIDLEKEFAKINRILKQRNNEH
jgi:predicted nuclease with TOPRIM domain